VESKHELGNELSVLEGAKEASMMKAGLLIFGLGGKNPLLVSQYFFYQCFYALKQLVSFFFLQMVFL
jgi:hypothetical protein